MYFCVLATGLVPLTLTDSIVREDENGDQYIQLPLELAFASVDPVTTATPIDRMKTEDYGVFDVQMYKSNDPDTFTSVKSLCSFGANLRRLYISGTYGLKDNFRVFCLCRLDESVSVDRFTTELHEGYGKEGVKEENQIPYNLNYYTINSDTNQISANKLPNGTNPVANTQKYINFTGIFYTPKFDLYETYVTFNDTYFSIPFRNTLSVDNDTGEYVTMRHLDTGSLIQLENATEMKAVRRGTYLLSVMSKPMRTYTPGDEPPSAIQAVLDCKHDPGGTPAPGQSTSDYYPEIFTLMSSQEFIEQISVLREPLEYRETTRLLNRTRRYNDTTFTSVVENDILKLIVPDSGYDLYPISGTEGVKLKMSYFSSNLFQDGVHNRLNLKIRMRNESPGATSMQTPNLSNIDFKVKYI